MKLATYFKSYSVLRDMQKKKNNNYPILISYIKGGKRGLEKSLINIYQSYFDDILSKYKDKPFCSSEKAENIVWIFWWQGSNNMPPIVNSCYQRAILLNPDKKICLLTKDNIDEYLEINPKIKMMVENKTISITFFSDYLRMGLLAKYGGIWLDATVYLTRSLNPLFSGKLYTNKQSRESQVAKDNIISEAQWSGFYIGSGNKDCILFSFLHEAMEYLIVQCKYNPYYFTIDLLIRIAYANLPQVKKEIDSLPISSPDIHIMASLWNNEFNQKVVDDICKKNELLKLNNNWKKSEKPNRFYSYFSSKEAINRIYQ